MTSPKATTMKRLSTILVLLCVALAGTSQNKEDYLSQVQTLDGIMETLYSSISGEAGEKRDWDLFRFLFVEDAQLLPSRIGEDGKTGYQAMSPQGYVDNAGEWLEKNGFFEKEIYRVVESYGSMTHLFSTYESYRSESDEKPFTRGINSIQLMNDGERWWIVNIYWLGETEGNPIPTKYLPK